MFCRRQSGASTGFSPCFIVYYCVAVWLYSMSPISRSDAMRLKRSVADLPPGSLLSVHLQHSAAPSSEVSGRSLSMPFDKLESMPEQQLIVSGSTVIQSASESPLSLAVLLPEVADESTTTTLGTRWIRSDANRDHSPLSAHSSPHPQARDVRRKRIGRLSAFEPFLRYRNHREPERILFADKLRRTFQSLMNRNEYYFTGSTSASLEALEKPVAGQEEASERTTIDLHHRPSDDSNDSVKLESDMQRMAVSRRQDGNSVSVMANAGAPSGRPVFNPTGW